MSILNTLLGQAGIDETFTNWDAARDFVIFQTIIPNPRLTDLEKVNLQKVEEYVFSVTSGSILESEKTEIAKYFRLLQQNFPNYTNDQQFLDIFDAAVEVQADDTVIDFDDFFIPKPVKNYLKIVVGVGIIYLLVRK